MSRPTTRVIASALLFTLIYSPLLGGVNGTVAAAQQTTKNTAADSALTTPATQLNVILQLLLGDDPLPEPQVQTVTPVTIAAGGTITLTGNNLTQVTGLFLNGVELFIIARSAGSITVTVPAMSGTGLLNVLSANGWITQTGYQITVSAPATPVTVFSYEYNANGNRTKITDPLNRVTDQTYDALNRLKTQLQPAPIAGAARPLTQYGYDGLDQLTSVTDPRTLVTSYTVDGLGKQTVLTSPDTGATNKTFDEVGNLKTSTDARLKMTTYTYDALNRVTSVTYASGTPTVFEYDGGAVGAPNAKGHLTKMMDEAGETSYVYDVVGRLLDKKQIVGSGANAQTFHVNYSYGRSGTANGKLVSLTYPSGNQVNSYYDNAGRIRSLTINPTNGAQLPDTNQAIPLLSNIGYDALGNRIHWTWGNHTPTKPSTYTRTVDEEGRITSYPLGTGTSGGLNRVLTYDTASRVRAINHSGSGSPANFNQVIDYDDLDRLTGFVTNNLANNQSFQYDMNGNRTQAILGGATYSNTIAPTSNKLSAVSGPIAKTNIYDADGNLTADGLISYIYSDRGRMQSATIGVDMVSYLYNGLGQRLQKSGPLTQVSGGRNRYAYDEQGHLIGEYDVYGQAIQEMVYLGDQPVAVLKQTVNAGVSSTTVYYVFADHINTPRVIAQATDNQIVWRWDSDPFGKTAVNENPSALGVFTYNARFPGQYFDKETGLHYNYFRDYDPSTGRYVESDPIGMEGGINTYTYVGGNPLQYVDSTGLKCECVQEYVNQHDTSGRRFGTIKCKWSRFNEKPVCTVSSYSEVGHGSTAVKEGQRGQCVQRSEQYWPTGAVKMRGNGETEYQRGARNPGYWHVTTWGKIETVPAVSGGCDGKCPWE